MKISAYIPAWNRREPLLNALASIRAQTRPVDEILVIDDGSTDGTSERLAGEPGVRVIRHPANLGRGAARARATIEAAHELILCCDTTCTLAPDFVEKALPWFDDPRVAGVYGRITQPPARNAVERWRGRHLFRLEQEFEVRRGSLLSTTAAIVRRSAVLGVGNYATHLRHTEDGELGERLLAAGHDVVFDPHLTMTSSAANTLAEVLERYWRWNVGSAGVTGWRAYARQVVFSARVMAVQDLRAGDPIAALISLFSPHYQFWRSRSQPAPRSGRPGGCRIALVHDEYARRRPECDAGVHPRNQLWGADALEAAGFALDPVQPSRLGWIGRVATALSRLSRGRLPDLRVDLEVLARHRDADAVYVATGQLTLVPILRGLGLFRPRIVSWFFGPVRPQAWWKARGLTTSGLVLRGLDGALCLTRKTADSIRSRCPRAKVRAVDWGADIELFTPDPGWSPGEYLFANGKTLRDYRTLLAACAETKLPVRIIAPRSCVAGCRIPENVRFVESSQDPPDAAISYAELRDWYAGATAVLIPLFDDPDDTCGLTNLVEAIAMGRPIIKTRSGCLDVDVEALGVGLHVAPGDVQGWRDAVQSLHDSPGRAAAMGTRGLELARAHFNSERFGRDVVAFVREVLVP